VNLVAIGAAASLGLLGGAHCVAMCGGGTAWVLGSRGGAGSLGAFHAGRLAGYAAAGAILAAASASLQWLAQVAGAARPVWIVLNVALLLFGAVLLITARHPAIVQQWGWRLTRLWRQPALGSGQAQPIVLHGICGQAERGRAWGVWRAACMGLAWAFVPCGMLYSALLLASFAGGALDGAATMAAFAAASGVQLAAAQYWIGRWPQARAQRREAMGTRLAGAVCMGTAAYALAAQLAGPAWLASVCRGLV
jgi:sulfite exporter TauE/SafE